MKLFAGIDGGQSTSVAVIGSASRILGRGTGPAADLVGDERDSPRQRAALEATLDAALAAAGLPQDSPFEAIVAGISGFEVGRSAVPDLAARTRRSRIVHDSLIAHAGALGGAPGILVIAGTGSVALGNDEAQKSFVRAGGWGYFFGDEGSALWIGRTAVRRAMASEDRGESSVLGDRAREFFGLPTLGHVQAAFAHGELERSTLARFARETLECARAGDPGARAIRAEATRALAELCATIDARLMPGGRREIRYTGGLFADRDFVRSFEHAVAERRSHAVVRPAERDAPTGAYELALRA